MTKLSTTAFLSKYLTIFADNTSREISENDLRDFRQDIADSFASIGDGLITDWDMSTNLFPSNSYKGQRFYGTGTTTLVDRNGDVIPSGVILTSLTNGASTSDPTEWALQYTII